MTFKTTGNSSDSSTKQTTIDGLVSEGGDIFSAVAADNAYQGRDGRGVKLGTSSKAGSMVFTLAQSMKVTSIKFTAMWYKDGEQSITVNEQDFTALTSSMTEYTVTLDGSAITEISISTPAKRAYIGTLTIVTEGGSVTQTVATPTFSPEGGVFTEAQDVTINCSTSGATIYYTTDGSNPTTSSNVYSSAISVEETTTIKAIAVKDGMNNSSVAEATYTIISIDGEAWVETSLAALTEDDVFVIVGDNGSTYALSLIHI